MREPMMIPITTPHGEEPKRRSAPQPRTSRKPTEQTNAIPMDQAIPERRIVSAAESFGADDSIYGSFAVIAGSSTESKMLITVGSAGLGGSGDPVSRCETWSLSSSRKFLSISGSPRKFVLWICRSPYVGRGFEHHKELILNFGICNQLAVRFALVKLGNDRQSRLSAARGEAFARERPFRHDAVTHRKDEGFQLLGGNLFAIRAGEAVGLETGFPAVLFLVLEQQHGVGGFLAVGPDEVEGNGYLSSRVGVEGVLEPLRTQQHGTEIRPGVFLFGGGEFLRKIVVAPYGPVVFLPDRGIVNVDNDRFQALFVDKKAAIVRQKLVDGRDGEHVEAADVLDERQIQSTANVRKTVQ